MGPKPPIVAAVISLILPGLGHLYAGAWGRGMSILTVSYFFMVVFGAAGGNVLLFTYPFLLLPVAYDAWKTAHREHLAENAELAAITVSLPGALLLGLSWLAARSTVRVLRGQEPMTTRSLWNEIASTLFIVCVGVLLFMIVWPSYSGLFRKSAEGVMKGNLGLLRLAFNGYRAERSENPPSLEALVESKHLAELPRLWPKQSGIPHAREAGTILLPDGIPTDSGKWAYAIGSSTPIFIDCTHTDTRGNAWASY